jgi:hypothetical protein
VEKPFLSDAGGGPANIGRLTASRFATQIQQLEELAVLPKGKIKVEQAMTAEYLP